METITVTMDFPKDVLLAANIPTNNARVGIMQHLALYMFKERILSFGKASELSGMDKVDFLSFAGRKGVSLNYDADDFQEDLRTIESLSL